MTALLQSIALVMLSIGLIATNLTVARLQRRLRTVTEVLLESSQLVVEMSRTRADPR